MKAMALHTIITIVLIIKVVLRGSHIISFIRYTTKQSSYSQIVAIPFLLLSVYTNH